MKWVLDNIEGLTNVEDVKHVNYLKDNCGDWYVHFMKDRDLTKIAIKCDSEEDAKAMLYFIAEHINEDMMALKYNYCWGSDEEDDNDDDDENHSPDTMLTNATYNFATAINRLSDWCNEHEDFMKACAKVAEKEKVD